MVCGKCGEELEEGTKFCTKCGADAQFFLDPTKDTNATLSLVFGIIGIVFPIIPIIPSIVGIIMGRMGLKSTKRKRAMAGLVISIIGIVLAVTGGLSLLFLFKQGHQI
jgi:hypothetical protein